MGLSPDLLEGLPDRSDIRPFTTFQSLRKRLEERRKALEKDQARNQFLVLQMYQINKFRK